MMPCVSSTVTAVYSSASIVLRIFFGILMPLFTPAPRLSRFLHKAFSINVSLGVTGSAAIWCLAFFLSSVTSPIAHAGAITEYELKAVFLYKILKYVHQPEYSPAAAMSTLEARMSSSSTYDDDQMEMCIVGLNPFASHLDRVLKKVNRLHPRKVSAKYLRRFKPTDVDSCDLVFLSKSERRELDHVIEHMQGLSILTVSDIEGFAKKKGMIEFVFNDGSIQMEINLLAVSKSSLSISANLLEIAKKVYK